MKIVYAALQKYHYQSRSYAIFFSVYPFLDLKFVYLFFFIFYFFFHFENLSKYITF